MMPLDESLFGAGIYSPRQAARLIGSNAQEVLRWTRGSGPNNPLWKAHYQYLDDTTELSFLDLIEIRVVRALKASGISTQAIRFALNLAQHRFGVNRPLATRDFKVSGAEILMEAIEDDGELISLSKKNPGQKVFTDIVRQSLSDLEYEDSLVARWRPATAQHVVIDPKRQFGSPIVDDFGLSTQMIYSEFRENNNAKYLAKTYEVPLKYINDAIRYEQKLDLG